MASRTKHPEIFADLAAPFDPAEVKSRQAPGGRKLSYITARTVMNRLDTVLGPENWWDRYVPGEHSVMCELTIELPDGKMVTKCDAGGYAGMADQGDDDKSGFSDAFKRAAAKLSIGRYLYRDGTPDFGGDTGTAPQPQSAPAPGRSNGPPPRDDRPSRPESNGGGGGNYGPPRSGRGLFAWIKETEQKNDVGMLKYLNNWGKLQEFPDRIVDWDEQQVALAHAEGMRKLAAVCGTPEDDSQDGPARTPQRAEQTPRQASPTPDSPGAARMAGQIVGKQRDQLIDKVWELARLNASVAPGGPNPSDGWFFKALAEIEDGIPTSGGHGEFSPIQDITTCNNTDLLARYLESANEQLTFARERPPV